ncbi:MAG: hypothetical protein ACI4AK_09080, partial [Lepagella sp.]
TQGYDLYGPKNLRNALLIMKAVNDNENAEDYGNSQSNNAVTNYNKPIFMNLAYSLDTKWIGYSNSYSDYLEEFINKFNPSILSYDYYPVYYELDKLGNPKPIEVNTTSFYQALEIYLQKSKQHGIPFWAHCLCLKHDVDKKRFFIYPTVGMMRFEAFSALAYGAQGVVYWQYRVHGCESGKLDTLIPALPSPVSKSRVVYSECESSQINDYPQEAPIDINGNQTPIWDMVKTVNEEIIDFDYVFYNCDIIEHSLCAAHGVWKVGYGCLRQLVSNGDGVLVSHIKNETENINGQKNVRNYIVIVSRDPFNSQEIDLYYHSSPVNKPSARYIIHQRAPKSYIDSMDSDFQENNGTANITLEPGGYAIIEYRISYD